MKLKSTKNLKLRKLGVTGIAIIAASSGIIPNVTVSQEKL